MSPGTYRCIYHWWKKLIPALINVSSIPVTPLQSIGPTRSSASWLRFQLLPWHDLKTFLTFQLPPLSYSSTSPVFLFYVVLVYTMAKELFLSVCPVHFHFCSLICTTTGFSCAFLESWFPYYSAYFAGEAH